MADYVFIRINTLMATLVQIPPTINMVNLKINCETVPMFYHVDSTVRQIIESVCTMECLPRKMTVLSCAEKNVIINNHDFDKDFSSYGLDKNDVLSVEK
jgi:hypothetical protein